MSEERKLVRARKQLLITGVVCVTIVIFALWLVNLRSTLAQNSKKYPSNFGALKNAPERVRQFLKQ